MRYSWRSWQLPILKSFGSFKISRYNTNLLGHVFDNFDLPTKTEVYWHEILRLLPISFAHRVLRFSKSNSFSSLRPRKDSEASCYFALLQLQDRQKPQRRWGVQNPQSFESLLQSGYPRCCGLSNHGFCLTFHIARLELKLCHDSTLLS